MAATADDLWSRCGPGTGARSDEVPPVVGGLATDRPRLPQAARQLIAAAVNLAGVLGAAAVEVGDLIWWPWASTAAAVHLLSACAAMAVAVDQCGPHR
jgi:hypothetical protein